MLKKYNHINIESLIELCKDDKIKQLKYLKQFLDLIPISKDRLEYCIKTKNRVELLGEIHYMLPQLIFFGIHDFTNILKKKDDPIPLTFEELTNYIKPGLIKIDKALEEIEIHFKHIYNNTSI